MAKKKYHGHYCKICGEHKANEKFTGKGHAVHICKACQSLPADEQTDMRRCRDVERLFGKSLSRQDWELLEKYAKKYAGKESGQFAQGMLEDKRHRYTKSDIQPEETDDCAFDYEDIDSLPIFPEKKNFAKLDQEYKALLREYIRRNTADYCKRFGKAPAENELAGIKKQMLCLFEEEYHIILKDDQLLRSFVRDNVVAVNNKLQIKTEENG